MRIALPVAFFTFGLGSFLIMGVGVLAVFNAIPGVEVGSVGTGVVVAVVMAGIAGRDQQRAGDQRGRGLLPPGPPPQPGRRPAARRPPGVLFLQIDGLGHAVARRAVRDGSMPTLAAWLRVGQPRAAALAHRLELADRRQPVRHPAGLQRGVVGFRWYDKARDRVVTVSRPRTPPRSSGCTPTAAACSPATAPGAATCSPATRRTSR